MLRMLEHFGDAGHVSEPEPLHLRTLDEVGRELGLSREYVRRIEHVALQKTRLALRVLELAPPAEAWAIVDSLRGAPLEQFKETYRLLRERATLERMSDDEH